jgi:hypothetical protein
MVAAEVTERQARLMLVLHGRQQAERVLGQLPAIARLDGASPNPIGRGGMITLAKIARGNFMEHSPTAATCGVLAMKFVTCSIW